MAVDWVKLSKCKTMDEFLKVAIEESKNETPNECPWCNAEYTIIDDDFGQPLRPKMINFCFYCGRPLK